ncbi:MAG: hypothetical protein BWY75_03684 [bacterium ADurb.Bin425]|nr:MAG: hypothetical protein BWY75_03684 [bacterium ADurb.Bin425]
MFIALEHCPATGRSDNYFTASLFEELYIGNSKFYCQVRVAGMVGKRTATGLLGQLQIMTCG